jgi:hypothetical protein
MTMPSQAERHAWHQFREVMARRQAEFDGQVPVALLCLAVCRGPHRHADAGPSDVDVDLTGALAILRPPGTTPGMVADLLERAARELRAGTLRS